jgi:hypothetical protein
MAEVINKRCPRCGRRPHDRMLVQCPDCRVPFVYDEPEPQLQLTPAQLRLLALQIFGSWKFWAVLVLLVGAAAGGVIAVADRIIDLRSQKYLSSLTENATNHLNHLAGQISNQIVLQFKQPRIQSAIEQAARDRATELFAQGVRTPLEAFQDALDQADTQLARSSNIIAQLADDALSAQQKLTNIPPPDIPQTNVVPVATTTPAAAPEAASGVKLALVNRVVSQAGNSYILTLFFRVTSSVTSGSVDVVAGTYKQTARIINFAPMTSGAIESPIINSTGDVARLKFSVNPRETPTLVLELSAPTIVRVASDSLDTDVTVPVAADRMQLGPATK